MINVTEVANEIYGILIKNQDESALLRLKQSKKERTSLARLAFGLAQAFRDEYDKRYPSKIPWEEN